MVWCTMILSQYVIVQHIVGRSWDEATRTRIVRHYEGTRTPEGAWGLHPESAGYVFTTTLAYVALRLGIGCYEFPGDVDGKFDHLIVDLNGHRLFTTPHKSVDVFDLDTGKLIHRITGVEVPHALLYRQDLQRLYVTDGEPGALKIFDGRDYKPIGSISLAKDADSIGSGMHPCSRTRMSSTESMATPTLPTSPWATGASES